MRFPSSFALGLFILTLSCCFGFLLAFYARFFVMLSFAEFRENAGTGGCTLKATKSAIQGFAFLHSNFCHFSPPLHGAERSDRTSIGAIPLQLYTIFSLLSRAFFLFLKKLLLSYNRFVTKSGK